MATPLLVTGGVNVVALGRVSDPTAADIANKGIVEDHTDLDLFSLDVGVGLMGILINAMLADAAVVISVALQHGISAQALAKSVGRQSETPITPADLARDQSARLPASPIGAALDLLRSFERPESH